MLTDRRQRYEPVRADHYVVKLTPSHKPIYMWPMDGQQGSGFFYTQKLIKRIRPDWLFFCFHFSPRSLVTRYTLYTPSSHHSQALIFASFPLS
jgi:hypothetical protein